MKRGKIVKQREEGTEEKRRGEKNKYNHEEVASEEVEKK